MICFSITLVIFSAIIMEKIFYITRNSELGGNGENKAPNFDRFQRVEQLNSLLETGWSIKGFETTSDDSYFLLEK